MKLLRVILVVVAAAALAGCSNPRASRIATPTQVEAAARAAGAQYRNLGGLTVTLQSSSASLPDARSGIPADPGSGKRWISIVATLTNTTKAPIVVAGSIAVPQLVEASGTVVESAFEGLHVPSTSDLSSVLLASPSRGLFERLARKAPGLAAGDAIRITGQWAVPDGPGDYRFVWDTGSKGVARFRVP